MPWRGPSARRRPPCACSLTTPRPIACWAASTSRPAGNEEALAALQAALSHDSQDPLTYQLLASVYTALGDEAEAAQASQQAVALHQAALAGRPADAYDTQLALGDAYVGASQYEQAVAAYQAAAALKPDAAAPHRGLGNAYYWQGQLDQAIAEYQQAAALAPQDPERAAAGRPGPGANAATWPARSRLSRRRPGCQAAIRRRICCWAGSTSSRTTTPKRLRPTRPHWPWIPADADAWYVLGSLRNLQDDLAGAAEAAQKAVDS